jgi:hypothetical protein
VPQSKNSPPENTAQVTPIDRLVALFVLVIVVVGCFFVLAPFLTAMLWAFIL